jgi:hypothetical protein
MVLLLLPKISDSAGSDNYPVLSISCTSCTGAVPRAHIMWSLHEQCHQLSGWGVVSLLYLLACALQYRYLNNIMCWQHNTTTTRKRQVFFWKASSHLY